MKSPHLALTFFTLLAALSGCDSSVYTATKRDDGTVIILNRLTGDVRLLTDQTMTHIKSESEIAEHKPALADDAIPLKPVNVHVHVEYRDGKMLVRSEITPPDKEKYSASDWERWREFMESSKQMSSEVTVHFADSDHFTVAEMGLSASDLHKIVGEDGKVHAYGSEKAVSISPRSYSAISEFRLGWNTWPDFENKGTTDLTRKDKKL
jgi:hypothetical protein